MGKNKFKKMFITLSLIFFGFSLLVLTAYARSSENYCITADVINAGGPVTEAESENYNLFGSVGQSVISLSQGTSAYNGVDAGFLYHVQGSSTPDYDDICFNEDNCPTVNNPNQNDLDEDGLGDVCDNCPIIFNPTQANRDADEYGDACDICPDDPDNDADNDLLCANEDNCPRHSNSLDLGMCVRQVSGVILSYREGSPPSYITCTSDSCALGDAYCDMSQGDFNANGIGDACECYADCDCNTKVDLADLVIMKEEFLRTNCGEQNPCDADCNADGKVDLSDLVIMKLQFLRADCPACQ